MIETNQEDAERWEAAAERGVSEPRQVHDEAADEADTTGHMIAQYNNGPGGGKGPPGPGPDGVGPVPGGGGGDLGALVPEKYKWAANFIGGLRPGDVIPFL
jgi:hypothetical protein